MRGNNRVCAPFRVRVIQRSGQADEDAARAVLPTEGGAAEPERESVQQGISNVSLFDHYLPRAISAIQQTALASQV